MGFLTFVRNDAECCGDDNVTKPRYKTPMRPKKLLHIEEPDEPSVAAWQKLFDIDNLESLMQGAARTGRAMSYSQTLDALGYQFSRPKMRALCVALGEVDRRAKARGEPELAVLVVRASDNIPGAGWWAVNDDDTYKGPWEGPLAESYIKGIQEKAFEYWRGR